MCPQAGFQAQAGQLARVENRGDVAHLGQGFIQGVAQHRALALQVVRQATLEPFALQLGSREQLADIVMQVAAEAVALVFLHLQQAFGQFLRLELDGFARTPLTQPHQRQRGQVEQQHRQRQGVGANIGPQAEQRRAQAQGKDQAPCMAAGHGPCDE